MTSVRAVPAVKVWNAPRHRLNALPRIARLAAETVAQKSELGRSARHPRRPGQSEARIRSATDQLQERTKIKLSAERWGWGPRSRCDDLDGQSAGEMPPVRRAWPMAATFPKGGSTQEIRFKCSRCQHVRGGQLRRGPPRVPEHVRHISAQGRLECAARGYGDRGGTA